MKHRYIASQPLTASGYNCSESIRGSNHCLTVRKSGLPSVKCTARRSEVELITQCLYGSLRRCFPDCAYFRAQEICSIHVIRPGKNCNLRTPRRSVHVCVSTSRAVPAVQRIFPVKHREHTNEQRTPTFVVHFPRLLISLSQQQQLSGFCSARPFVIG